MTHPTVYIRSYIHKSCGSNVAPFKSTNRWQPANQRKGEKKIEKKRKEKGYKEKSQREVEVEKNKVEKALKRK